VWKSAISTKADEENTMIWCNEFFELGMLSPGSAMEIPLADVGGIGLANLRSAVHRAATSQGIEIQTLADEKNFYVWKAAGSEGEPRR
jgi:hypothetical protein